MNQEHDKAVLKLDPALFCGADESSQLVMFKIDCLFGYDMCHFVCIPNIDTNRDAISKFGQLVCSYEIKEISFKEAFVLQKYFDFLWEGSNDSYDFVIVAGTVDVLFGEDELTKEHFEKYFDYSKYPNWSKLGILIKENYQIDDDISRFIPQRVKYICIEPEGTRS